MSSPERELKKSTIHKMAPSVKQQLASIQKSIDALKISTAEKKSRPKKISDCTSKDQLKKFTVKELTAWIKKHDISVKKINEKHKKDFIKLIWDYLDVDSEYDSDSETSDYSETDTSSSESDSDSD